MKLPRLSFSIGLGAIWHRLKRSRGLAWVDAWRARWQAKLDAIEARKQAEAERLAAEEARLRKPPAPVPERRTNRPRRKVAVIVGINKYGRNHDLAGCITDAKRLAERFRRAGWEVVLLLDHQATKMAVMARLREISVWIETGDRVWLCFSGHGSLLPDPHDPTGSRQVMCLADCLADNSTDTFVNGCLSLYELMRLLNTWPAGAEFGGWFDCCHEGIERAQVPYLAGAKLLERHGPVVVPRFLPPPPGVFAGRQPGSVQPLAAIGARDVLVADPLKHLFLAGCRAQQTSADTVIDNTPCGAFTAYLLAAFDASPLNSVGRLNEAAMAKLHRDGYDQTPVASGPRARTVRRMPWTEA